MRCGVSSGSGGRSRSDAKRCAVLLVEANRTGLLSSPGAFFYMYHCVFLARERLDTCLGQDAICLVQLPLLGGTGVQRVVQVVSKDKFSNFG